MQARLFALVKIFFDQERSACPKFNLCELIKLSIIAPNLSQITGHLIHFGISATALIGLYMAPSVLPAPSYTTS